MQEIEKLKEIMKALRNPAGGCPWDIQQDFSTIAPYTVEEAYEVADAIEREDMHDLKSELGDLLFQVIFHSELADERGLFNFEDVVDQINEKLIRRHPHVFEDEEVQSEEHLAQRWEQHKHDERKDKNEKEKSDDGTFDGIASSLPALKWSHKIQKRAARTGFDWPNIWPVFEKLEEELAELKQEIDQKENHDRILDELGDVLFVCVNIAMHLGVDAERALRHGNRKFISRFIGMEQLMQGDGKQFSDLSLEQMEEYWQRVKALQGASGKGQGSIP